MGGVTQTPATMLAAKCIWSALAFRNQAETLTLASKPSWDECKSKLLHWAEALKQGKHADMAKPEHHAIAFNRWRRSSSRELKLP